MGFKLLFITDLYPSRQDDPLGALALHYYVKQWVRDGHSVEVINIHSPNLLEWRAHLRRNLPSSFTVDKVKVINRMMLRLPGDFNIYPFFSKEYIAQFDAIIGHMPRGARLAYLLSCKYEKPYVIGLHFTDYKRSRVRESGLSRQYRQMLSSACLIHFRSVLLKEQFEKIAPIIKSKSAVMPGGVDEAWLESVPERAFSNMHSLKLLTVAQLIKRKNVDRVISACKVVNIEGLTYRVVGVGEELHALQELSSDLKIDFMGKLDRAEVRNEMDNTDVFILASTEETFGLVYLEAMARGCITIGTVGEGIDGVIKHGENGFLCKPDLESIGQMLNHVLNLSAPELKAISQAAMVTSSDYCYTNLARSFISRLETVVSLN